MLVYGSEARIRSVHYYQWKWNLGDGWQEIKNRKNFKHDNQEIIKAEDIVLGIIQKED